MAELIIGNKSDLIPIADAIREKIGSAEEMTLVEMVEAVRSIEASGDNTAAVLNSMINGSIAEITSHVMHIGPYAFANRLNLKTATFPNATTMDEWVFTDCSQLSQVNLPRITTLNNRAFNQCTNLTTVNLPLATSIGVYAFYGCSSLETIDMSSITTINEHGFDRCSALKITDFPFVTYLGAYVFNQCNSLTSINFPLITDIAKYTFYECKNLETVDIPLVTIVGQSAFYGCEKLQYIDLPKVIDLRRWAFSNCYQLKSVILRSETLCELPYADTFGKCYHILGTVNETYNPSGAKDGYIYVPKALIEDYKAHANWSTYASQFRVLEEYTVDGTTTGELDESKI